jgi:WD40 repeat protein
MWIQKVPGGGVLALAYSPDGRTLYTKDGGGWVSKWDVQTRTGTRLFCAGHAHRYYGGFGLAGNGRYLAVIGTPVIAVETATDRSESWAPSAMTTESVVPYAVQPDPRAPRLLVLNQNGSVTTWDLRGGAPGPPAPDVGPPATPLYFEMAQHGQALVRTRDGFALYELPAGVVARFSPDIGRAIFSARPAPDGCTAVLIGGHAVYPWDYKTGTLRRDRIVCYLPGAIFAFHPSAPVFAALNANGQLTLFDLNTGGALRTLDFGLGVRVHCVAFSPDGLTCAVGGSNKQFAVFDVDL